MASRRYKRRPKHRTTRAETPATEMPNTGHRRQMSAEAMSAYNADVMDEGERRFLSSIYGGCKEETPNGTTGIPCWTTDERRKTQQSRVQIKFGRNEQRKSQPALWWSRLEFRQIEKSGYRECKRESWSFRLSITF